MVLLKFKPILEYVSEKLVAIGQYDKKGFFSQEIKKTLLLKYANYFVCY